MKVLTQYLLVVTMLLSGAVWADDDTEAPQSKEKESQVRLFIGGEVGYAAAFLSSTDNATDATTSDFRVPYGVVGAKAGIMGFFGDKQRVGLRGYVSYHHSNDGEYYSHQTAFNTEVIWKLGKKFGIFAGLGVGYASNAALSSNNVATTTGNQTTLITDPKGSGFILPVNVGFEVALDAHHTISVNVRAPSVAATERLGAANATNTYSARNILLTLGYAYQF